LLPLCLCIAWFLYLKSRGFSIAQGTQGFKYILVFSAVVAIFYTAMMYITQMQ
jgi:hypothetical protein